MSHRRWFGLMLGRARGGVVGCANVSANPGRKAGGGEPGA
jgi:hypothetical protein